MKKKIPKCFEKDWRKVSLNEFNNCKWNLAPNRQVRMLANLGYQCYHNIIPINLTSAAYHHRMSKLLESAKANLEYSFSYFLINEYRLLSQYLFEHTFGLKFNKKFVQKEATKASSAYKSLTKAELAKIVELNKYDIQLFNFAKKLFLQRINYFKKIDERD